MQFRSNIPLLLPSSIITSSPCDTKINVDMPLQTVYIQWKINKAQCVGAEN
jgi:hypothetical protein